MQHLLWARFPFCICALAANDLVHFAARGERSGVTYLTNRRLISAAA